MRKNPRLMEQLPPGSPLPCWLHVPLWLYCPIPFMEYCSRRYGHSFTLRFPNLTYVLTSDVDAIKQIFSCPAEKLRVRPVNFYWRSVVGDNSVLLMDGDRHVRERRVMGPPFHGERVQLHGTVIRDVTDAELERCPRGRPVAVHPLMQSITLEIIMRAVCSVHDDSNRRQFKAILTEMFDIASSPFFLSRLEMVDKQDDFGSEMIGRHNLNMRLFSPFISLVRWSCRRFYRLQAEAAAIVAAEVRRRRSSSEAGPNDVLDLLLSQDMTDAALLDEVMTLLVTGHETTATSLCWTLGRLLQHPDVLGKVCAELQEVVGDEPVNSQHLKSLPYLEATVKETLRLHSVVPAVGRQLHEPMQVGRWRLPAGVVVAPCIHLTHRRPDLWPQPTMFRPERFLGQPLSAFSYFPFGGGTRICLGMTLAMFEIRMVLARMLSRFGIRRQAGYVMRFGRRGVFFSPARGLPLILEERVGQATCHESTI